MAEVGRDLKTSSGLNPLLKQDHPEVVAQDRVKKAFEYFQGVRTFSTPRHPSPPFIAVATEAHVSGTLCRFGSKVCSSSKKEMIFFPPPKLGESNHFVFHVGIKSKLLLNRFSVGSRLES